MTMDPVVNESRWVFLALKLLEDFNFRVRASHMGISRKHASQPRVQLDSCDLYSHLTYKYLPRDATPPIEGS